VLLIFFYGSFLGKCQVEVADFLSSEQVDTSEDSTSLPLVLLALFEGSEHYASFFNQKSQFVQAQVTRPLTVGNL
jgi:hypothetical protein